MCFRGVTRRNSAHEVSYVKSHLRLSPFNKEFHADLISAVTISIGLVHSLRSHVPSPYLLPTLLSWVGATNLRHSCARTLELCQFCHQRPSLNMQCHLPLLLFLVICKIEVKIGTIDTNFIWSYCICLPFWWNLFLKYFHRWR